MEECCRNVKDMYGNEYSKVAPCPTLQVWTEFCLVEKKTSGKIDSCWTRHWLRHRSISYAIIPPLTPSFVCWRHHSFTDASICLLTPSFDFLRHHSTANAIIRLLTPSFVCWRQHLFADAIIRFLTPSFVCWRHHLFADAIICLLTPANYQCTTFVSLAIQ